MTAIAQLRGTCCVCRESHDMEKVSRRRTKAFDKHTIEWPVLKSHCVPGKRGIICEGSGKPALKQEEKIQNMGFEQSRGEQLPKKS